ncbi:hypothetical protein F5Y02DRAFT_431607 [Annulohypoxylon stygium]|nr:hypothetical protein F5Y02DRAFT_431607 [Annulohypoxylon stygium]
MPPHHDTQHDTDYIEGMARYQGSSQASVLLDSPYSPGQNELMLRNNPYVFRFWKWEIINFLLSTGLLGAMYMTLKRYDNQPVPEWGTINLSTLTAIMATFLRASIFFVITEIIGQAKWNYFTSMRLSGNDGLERQLIETSHFDTAMSQTNNRRSKYQPEGWRTNDQSRVIIG